MNSTLYLIPTPLYNDIPIAFTSEDIAKIQGLQLFFYETLKPCRRAIYNIWKQNNFWGNKSAFDNIIWEPLFLEKTQANDIKRIHDIFLQAQKASQSIGLLTDAGCPGIADPGAVVVQLAHQLNWRVTPLVGPSSLLLALMGFGLNGQKFAFNGYLPVKKEERRNTLKKLESRAKSNLETQLFIETPYRNESLLIDAFNTLAPDTIFCIACNLTAPDEFIARKAISEWKKKESPNLDKKPTVFGIYIG